MSLRPATQGIIPLSILLLLTIPHHVVAQSPSGDPRDPYANYARVTPSMAIIIVVLIAALFFMGFFSIYIRHCAEVAPIGRGVVGVPNGGRSRRLAAARGLDASVIETFPTLEYSVVKGLKIGKGALECAVCLNEFEDEETLRLIPKCDHVFHPECIDEWLSSHTTCPVCRANLAPEPGESAPQLSELHPELFDPEAQTGAVGVEREGGTTSDDERHGEMVAPGPEVISVNQTLNRNRTRGSRSGRPPRFPRSHSTGHSLVQPGEDTERFTLRVPAEVRKQIMNRHLDRTLSIGALPREGSTRRGYRTGGEGSSRGKSFNYRRLEGLDQQAKSDRWIFMRTPSFLARASSLLTRTSSIKSPKVAAKEGADGSNRSAAPNPNVFEPGLPPV